MSTGKPLYLIGFMASGKTTLGNALAERLPHLHFTDLDHAIETATGKSISDIFDTDGEDTFRLIEAETLRAVSTPGSIIACGGGTPCHHGNMDFMLTQGTVVWLVANDDITVERLQLARGQRPLVDRMLDTPEVLRQHIDMLKSSRQTYYGRAHHTFDSSRLDNAEQIEESCRLFIEKFKI